MKRRRSELHTLVSYGDAQECLHFKFHQVGSYEYFYQRTYLCDEDFCNEDEAHARDNRSPRMGVSDKKSEKNESF